MHLGGGSDIGSDMGARRLFCLLRDCFGDREDRCELERGESH